MDSLIKDLKREIKYIYSLSFKDYLLNLIFPKDMGYFFILFRILTLFFVIKFFFNLIMFIFKICFNFYFIFSLHFFEILFRLNELFFENYFFFKYILKIIKFFRYIFLFMFFVNIREDMKKKNIPLWVYILEFFADILIYIIGKQLNLRYIFYPILKICEVFILVLHIFLSIISAVIDYVFYPIYKIFRTFIFIRLFTIYKYIRAIFKYKQKGKYHINNMLLFHISNDLKKKGFIAPICGNMQVWLKAKLDYKIYRKKFIYAELTPDVVDDDAMNIYIYLKSLLKDTRYQRNFVSFFDIFYVVFPYNIFVFLFFLFFYFFIGLVYMIYMFFFPIIGILFLVKIGYVIYDVCFYVYCLCIKDIELYLIYIKKKEINNKKNLLQLEKIKVFFKLNIKFIVTFILNFFKKFYEKIFR